MFKLSMKNMVMTLTLTSIHAYMPDSSRCKDSGGRSTSKRRLRLGCACHCSTWNKMFPIFSPGGNRPVLEAVRESVDVAVEIADPTEEDFYSHVE